MTAVSLALSAAIHLAAAAGFALVGRTLLQRGVTGESRPAAVAFVVWCWGFSAYLLIQGAQMMLVAGDRAPFGLLVAARYVTIPILAVSAWGLAYHILYLYTGARRLATPLAVFYGLCGVAYLTLVATHTPVGVAAQAWTFELAYAQPLEGPAYSTLLTLFGLPLILGSLAYASLAFRVTDPAQRYRALLVGASIFAWVASGLAARIAGDDVLKFATIPVLGIAAAIGVVLAYHPPARVRAALGMTAPPQVQDAKRRRNRGARDLEARCRDLI